MKRERIKLYIVFPFAVLWYLLLLTVLLLTVLLTVCVFSVGLVGFAIGGVTVIFPLEIVASDFLPATLFLGGAAALSLSGVLGILAIKLGQAGGRSFLKFRSFSEDARCPE